MAATTTEGKIADALFTKLAALTLSPVLEIAWPDVAFTPPDEGMWLEASIFDDPVETMALTAGGRPGRSGFLQVTVISPQNVGATTMRDVAGEVIDWFAYTTRLTSGSVAVDISGVPYMSPPVVDPPYIRVPITIPFRSYAA